uniref:Ig-like domain-containing protein n=1 Tax=Dicentrarchus labrax TaxID=13489 RepID=A0A8C4DRE6_DICLA
MNYDTYFSLIFSTAVAEQLSPRIVGRVGDEVTLPCDNVRDYQDKCQRTSWLFVGSGNTMSILLIDRGQIGENTNSKSDRLSVTANCSLVIKNVTVEDVGQYTCRQFISGQQQGPDSHVHLSVITSEYLHHNVFSSNLMKFILLLLSFSHNISIFTTIADGHFSSHRTVCCYCFCF